MKWFWNKKCESIAYDAGWNDALYNLKEVAVNACTTKKSKKDTSETFDNIITILRR